MQARLTSNSDHQDDSTARTPKRAGVLGDRVEVDGIADLPGALTQGDGDPLRGACPRPWRSGETDRSRRASGMLFDGPSVSLVAEVAACGVVEEGLAAAEGPLAEATAQHRHASLPPRLSKDRLGDLFGLANAPQTNTPERDVANGENFSVSQKPYGLRLMPRV
jgi:hypothetical protein